MNLWAKHTGQLLLIAVALFFFSCQDELKSGGYPNPNPKFKVRYIEIPLESSVFLRDSLRTSNFAHYGEISRLLVGNYQDDAFGNVSAATATQFFTSTAAKLPSTAVYDSISISLQFDLYHYGSTSTSAQTISLYESLKHQSVDSVNNFFSKTNIPYSNLLGSKTFTINPADFTKFATSTTDYDTAISIRIRLDHAFGKRVFDSAYGYSTDASGNDTTFVTNSLFTQAFKGIVIKADNMDKVVGFNPLATKSVLLLHYHDDKNDSLAIPMVLGRSFNQIKSDKGATEVAQINKTYTDFLQESDNRYIESGVGILTKVDFSNFFAFADTVPNVMINSAEFVIESVQSSTATPPPPGLVLRILKDNNRLKKYNPSIDQDKEDLLLYNGLVAMDYANASLSQPAVVDADSVFYASGNTSPVIPYSSTNTKYSAVLSLFLQQLTLLDEPKTRFRNFALYPVSQGTAVPAATGAGKSVNRAVFPKDKIKLKITYTKPTAQQ